MGTGAVVVGDGFLSVLLLLLLLWLMSDLWRLLGKCRALFSDTFFRAGTVDESNNLGSILLPRYLFSWFEIAA